MNNDSINNELQRLLLRHQEENEFHMSFEKEFDFYRQVALGNRDAFERMRNNPPSGRGKLSEDPLRNEKYHQVVLIAMLTRFCVEEGLPMEEAYTLSDIFIMQTDKAKSCEEVTVLKNRIVEKYIDLMQEHHASNITSYYVVKATDYINRNITGVILATQVAENVGTTADYLSKLFKKETGLTIKRFINAQKCKTASYILKNSNASCTDIAVFLGFSSASHFVERFKEVYKMTPNEYRKKKLL